MSSAEDARFMALALALGRRSLGRAWPNPAVGAVIVKDGVIVVYVVRAFRTIGLAI
jgi:diaminohydroxyphosphoribosylaminopyrimidine deaminase/5-amino-6-(5-phosphoribosylamino)uracil reductase